MPEERIKILLLDDDEIDRLAVQRYVEREQLPYDLETASSIAEARRRLIQKRYDLVLLDYQLPDGTGLEVLADVRDMPAIFITGSGDEKIAAKAMRQGAYDYLIKDPERNYLIVLPVTIKNVLDRKRAEKDLVESEIKHRLLLNSISLPVLALKEDMTILYCNKAYARFVGLDLEQLEGKNLLQIFPRLEETKTYQMYQKVLSTGINQESEGRHKDRFMHSDIYRTPWGILAIAEDITERKQSEDAMWHAKEDLELRVEERTRELAEANRLLQQSYDDTIRAITAAMDAKDNYTRGHSEEVKKIAVKIGQALKLDPDSLRRLEYAALLHDIGKIGVSGQLLTKGSTLTEYEFDEVKLHPQIGGKLLEQVDLLKDAGPIIAAHHENYDGSGYPKGLKGEEIPIESRIIAVADSYEAMTVDRPYRKAYSKEEAMQRLKNGSGTQFDPRIVEILLKVL
jgi:PAS domain S-box-containing protein